MDAKVDVQPDCIGAELMAPSDEVSRNGVLGSPTHREVPMVGNQVECRCDWRRQLVDSMDANRLVQSNCTAVELIP